MPTTPLNTSTPVQPPENILYVVLHGLISLVDVGAEGFIAYLLEMKDEHVYLYGDWLVEQKLAGRGKGQPPLVASLLNVVNSTRSAGTNDIDPQMNVVVSVSKAPSLTHPSVRAVFKLPRPRKIQYCISGKLDSDSLKGPANSINSIAVTPTQLSGIRIFEYTFADASNVQLASEDGTMLWRCPEARLLAPIDNRNIAVLHLYDEPAASFPDEATAQKHNQDEFNLSFAFLGVKLELVKQPGPVRPVVLIAGFQAGELDSLDQRERFVLEMMFKVRSGQDPKSDLRGSGSGGQICSAAHAIVTG